MSTPKVRQGMDDELETFCHGRRAKLAGCYRVLANPRDDRELEVWLLGFDSVELTQRGSRLTIPAG